MKKGLIMDIDHFSSHDGPGIRTVVFFKGCPLRCVWCHSPESQSFDPEPIRISGKCKRCGVCAGAECQFDAWRICGMEVSVDGIMDELLPDKIFYDSSGGGVTLSGGEPLSQYEFVHGLLQRLRTEGIHTIIETSGAGKWADIAALSAYTDIFYFDIKTLDTERHRRFTGADNEQILNNLTKLARLRGGSGIELRIPLIPGYNDSDIDISDVYAFAGLIGVTTVHLLPYNISAGAKYEWIDRVYVPGVLERQTAARILHLQGLAPDSLEVLIQ